MDNCLRAVFIKQLKIILSFIDPGRALAYSHNRVNDYLSVL
jgi:hypothetical protein